MNDKIKSYVFNHQKSSIVVCIGIIFLCAIGIWYFIRTNSNIDTTGIQHATTELHNAGEYNRQSIEYNKRAGDAIIRSKSINQRATTDVKRIIESTQGTATRIDRSQELVRDAKQDAINAKRIISESRSILENARARNQEGSTKSTASTTD